MLTFVLASVCAILGTAFWLYLGDTSSAVAADGAHKPATPSEAIASQAFTPLTADTLQPRPNLAVDTVRPQPAMLASTLVGTGSIAAWQEAVIGNQANGLRLNRILVSVGSRVSKGELLAEFDDATVRAELAQTQASVAEAEAAAAEARSNATRAREITESGALSAQQVQQYLTAETTARARLEALRAAERLQQLRLRQAQVRAPDDGTISSRTATLGAVMPPGQELFRLIHRDRLEWRAEVPATELQRLRVGMSVTVTPAGGTPIDGTLRMLAPTVDAATRNALVYVDLPAHSGARPGMFARGDFRLGSTDGLTLPQSAVLLRDGFHVVLRVGDDDRVSATKVTVGRRSGDRIEITGGLSPDARVVARGGAFLADGDRVHRVDVQGRVQP